MPKRPKPKAKTPMADAAPTGDLDQHRRTIEDLDARILDLAAQRMETAEKIARFKSARRIPLRNFEVEEQVRSRMERQCLDRGIDPALGRELALLLIGHSLVAQSPILESSYEGSLLRVLVVGGMGGMGGWMARFLSGQGHQVTLFDTAAGESPFPRVPTLDGGSEGADLVVLAVPMSACARLLRELAGFDARPAVAELCSLKLHLRAALEEARSAGLRVVSFHPMWGPEAKLLSGKRLLLVRSGNEREEELVRGLFAATSVTIHDLSLEEHDRRMAVVLGLAHLVNLGFARALALCGLSPEALREAAGVTFGKQLRTTLEVVSENPDLYFEIQRLSGSTSGPLERLQEALGDFKRAVEAGDTTAFSAYMEGAKARLSDAGAFGEWF
ncbi:MAG: prephenate dehydrogenase/arogenate dehydrogenase family protein [Acidobacteriota bacterium]